MEEICCRLFDDPFGFLADHKLPACEWVERWYVSFVLWHWSVSNGIVVLLNWLERGLDECVSVESNILAVYKMELIRYYINAWITFGCQIWWKYEYIFFLLILIGRHCLPIDHLQNIMFEQFYFPGIFNFFLHNVHFVKFKPNYRCVVRMANQSRTNSPLSLRMPYLLFEWSWFIPNLTQRTQMTSVRK